MADYFTQMRKNGTYVPSERQITHVREVLDLMRVMTGDHRFTEHVDEFEKSKEAITMCKVLDEVESRGEKRGISIGEARGISIGEARGEQTAMQLTSYLIRNGRSEDVIRAADDKEYLKQ